MRGANRPGQKWGGGGEDVPDEDAGDSDSRRPTGPPLPAMGGIGRGEAGE
jgi:hypothetical protein